MCCNLNCGKYSVSCWLSMTVHPSSGWMSWFALGWFWIPCIKWLPACAERCLCTSPSLCGRTQPMQRVTKKDKRIASQSHYPNYATISSLTLLIYWWKDGSPLWTCVDSHVLKYLGVLCIFSNCNINYLWSTMCLCVCFAGVFFGLSFCHLSVLTCFRLLRYSVRLCRLIECPMKLILQLTDTSNILPDLSLTAASTAAILKLDLEASLDLHTEELLHWICHCFLFSF